MYHHHHHHMLHHHQQHAAYHHADPAAHNHRHNNNNNNNNNNASSTTTLASVSTASGAVAAAAAANTTRSRRAHMSYLQRVGSQLSELNRWSVWRAVFLGQLLSLLTTCTGVTSQLLTSWYHVSAPTVQTLANYVLLCVVFTTWLCCRARHGGAGGAGQAEGGSPAGLWLVLRRRGWQYVLLAVCDVQANYLVVKAFNYTTLTSITLLDCFSIPTVLALSWIALKVRYRLVHIVGVSVCLVGVGCLVWADIEDARSPVSGHDRLLGDMLCLGGATLYGISNVGQEYAVKCHDTIEYLAMIGLFGCIVSGVQCAVLERQQLMQLAAAADVRVLALLAAFAAAQFLFYAVTPVVVRTTSAATVNLSLLTADFFSLIAGVLVFSFKFHVMYLLSFFLVVCGIVIYSSKPTPLHALVCSYRDINMSGDAPLIAADTAGINDGRGAALAGGSCMDGELTTAATSVTDFTRSISDASSAPSYGTLDDGKGSCEPRACASTGRGAHIPRSRSIPDRAYVPILSGTAAAYGCHDGRPMAGDSFTLGRRGRGDIAVAGASVDHQRPYRTLERTHGGAAARVHWAANSPRSADRPLRHFSTFYGGGCDREGCTSPPLPPLRPTSASASTAAAVDVLPAAAVRRTAQPESILKTSALHRSNQRLACQPSLAQDMSTDCSGLEDVHC